MTDASPVQSQLKVGGQTYEFFPIHAVPGAERLPLAHKILLENLLRHQDGITVTAEDIQALANWDPRAPSREIQYRPARVLMQDFTGVPAVVDLAAMRDAMKALGGDPARINPQQPVELVIDHSVQVDFFGTEEALSQNAAREFQRNRERYAFLKWGQNALENFRVVPPDTGIVHQVNIEYLARVVCTEERDGIRRAYFDTCVGTDSHTTMVNGLGVLGWGVGGIEAEASMLGQPISMLIPRVVGVRLVGALRAGVTATDLVLAIVERLRQLGVVGSFVEFYGPALGALPMGERTTIANMAPEYGATCGLFPIDAETLRYLRLTGRSEERIALVEAYARAQGVFQEESTPEADYSETLEIDLSTIEPALAGPRRPQDRVPLKAMAEHFPQALAALKAERNLPEGTSSVPVEMGGQRFQLSDGAIVIAAITSCTNTSNPSVMLAAGLLAKKAVERGLRSAPWVKTTLGPGSLAVTDYLKRAGLLEPLQQLGFYPVGYGCTVCIGNSGPLPEPVSRAIAQGNLCAVSILSGNRNFEGRVHAEVRMNYLASPPLVVAYAIAGRIDLDPDAEPLGHAQGRPVFLRDLWPSPEEIQQAIQQAVTREAFTQSYRDLFAGDARWQALDAPSGQTYAWPDSTYIRRPPYFEGMQREPEPVSDIRGARCLALLGDSITTDHISPAGAIKPDSPAGRYLQEQGVAPADFNSFGSRRGNHEVMMRGTFANIRLRNLLAPGTEGGVTRHQPSGELLSIYDAAMRYRAEGVPVIVIAGKEYGSGSSRDWAAKGPRLLGVRAVLAESYERIHRTNLVCMGILPLEFQAGESAASLGLTGRERYEILGLDGGRAEEVQVIARAENGETRRFQARVRIDTPNEVAYYQNGGILQAVLRKLAAG